MNRIALRWMGLTKNQQVWNKRARCYAGSQWADRDPGKPWAQKFDEFGNYIPKAQRKPTYIDNLGKEIIQDLAASVAGDDKFPTIQLSATKDVFVSQAPSQAQDGQDGVKGDNDPDQAGAQASDKVLAKVNESLSDLFTALASKTKLQQRFQKAVRRALVIESSYVYFKVVNGNPRLDVIDRTWIQKLEMDKEKPGWVKSLDEIYVTEDQDTNIKTGKPNRYWNRRMIDDEGEKIWKVKYDYEHKHTPPLMWGTPTENHEHELGFCPVIEVTNEHESILADPVCDNIIDYIEQTNEVDASLEENLDPQRYVIKDHNTPKHKRKQALMRGRIWEMEGRQVGQFSTDTGGINAGYQRLAEKREQIKNQCHVIENMPQDNQQSGVAITRRFTPKLNYLNTLRTSFGESLENLIDMMMLSLVALKKANKSVSLKSDKDLKIPVSTEYLINLSWGEFMPKSTQDKQGLISMYSIAEQSGYIAKKTAAKFVHKLFGIKDSEGELAQIEQEKEESREDQIEAFKAQQKALSDEDQEGEPDQDQEKVNGDKLNNGVKSR